ncbi:hypothetical protein C7H19_14920 [Aphanothece hegewaldii CCALA 016]|uniref:Uncharacterized protein n=1 Tax=Aphanothece hegewaldii CCALA 016 TaxID=2107694 RepID=A0A2T1LVZ5_9CHRO|nr:hypothetical protein [Aphanothece hegewaldii]PSF36032.1 hypothetical protein C7H19_14920 [Aphanothece hegewaldii CCALA 016]
MDDWHKEFWDVVDSVAQGIEQFVQDVTQAVEVIHNEIAIDIEQFFEEVFDVELELRPGENDLFPDHWGELSDWLVNPRVEPDPTTHPCCVGCQNYHGRIYGGNLLVCAMHPYGWQDETCPDWEGKGN